MQAHLFQEVEMGVFLSGTQGALPEVKEYSLHVHSGIGRNASCALGDFHFYI